MNSKYFKIEELVCREVYNKFGEQAWMFVDNSLIETLEIIREKILCVPMIVNNWKSGGEFTERGLRCNLCKLVSTKTAPYMSAHILGKAMDFDAKGMTAEQARKLIKKNQILLPYPIRLEEGVPWVHIDVYDCGGGKITTFKKTEK
ncbi:MAG: hypothetical protein RR293_07625 [Bacteroidales bacterium]